MKEFGLGNSLGETVFQVSKDRESESCLTIAEISAREGKPWTWVVRRIAPFKDQLDLTQKVRSLEELKVPRNVYVEIPFVAETDTLAEDWLTVTEIGDELNVDYKWVNRRILKLKAKGEWRLCYLANRPEFHLPPEALEELTEMRNQALEQFTPGTYLNLEQIAKIIGRHRLWVSNRLDGLLADLGAEPKLGLDKSGKAVENYPQEVIGLLEEERDKYEESGDWLTIPMLARQVGKDREWVERELEKLEVSGEYRHFNNSGRVDLSFGQDIFLELKARARDYVNPRPKWYTENALVEKTGKSRHWVQRRLKRISVEVGWFQDSRGVLRKHYPGAALTNLLQELEDWKVMKTIEFKEEKANEDDTAGRFLSAVRSGVTKSRRTLNKMGVSDSELEFWQREELVTRWANGQYLFTKKARLIADRIAAAERVASNFLEELKLFMEDEPQMGRSRHKRF